MLVLSRKQSEKVVIGDGIRVTITRISGSRVRVAIEAPEQISIRRGELQRVRPRLDDDRGHRHSTAPQ